MEGSVCPSLINRCQQARIAPGQVPETFFVPIVAIVLLGKRTACVRMVLYPPQLCVSGGPQRSQNVGKL